MVDKSSYFYLGGAISLSFFAFILALFIYMMFSPSHVTTYALQKDTFISISMDTPKEATKSEKKSVVTPVEEKHTASEAKKVNIGDLFSDVPTKDISKKDKVIKPEENKRKQDMQRKEQTKTNDDVDALLEKINNMNAKKDTESNPTSTAEEVNEYFAKIQALVYKHFNPPKNSEGNSVKAVIELSAIGQVIDFRILTYSSNKALNDECDKIKERLMGVLFPMNPEHKSGSTIINITSE